MDTLPKQWLLSEPGKTWDRQVALTYLNTLGDT